VPGVVIASRTDALLWRLVDDIFAGRDSREATAEWELAHYRAAAARYLAGTAESVDALVALMRLTDPKRLTTKTPSRAPERQEAA
jgi:hypothetical protein